MASQQELEPKDLGVRETLTVPEIPQDLERSTGIKVVQKNFTAQVKNDKATPIIQTPPAQVITVTPPGSRSTLLAWAKGSITNSITCLGMFWLRILKKALFFGWRVSEGNK